VGGKENTSFLGKNTAKTEGPKQHLDTKKDNHLKKLKKTEGVRKISHGRPKAMYGIKGEGEGERRSPGGGQKEYCFLRHFREKDIHDGRKKGICTEKPLHPDIILGRSVRGPLQTGSGEGKKNVPTTIERGNPGPEKGKVYSRGGDVRGAEGFGGFQWEVKHRTASEKTIGWTSDRNLRRLTNGEHLRRPKDPKFRGQPMRRKRVHRSLKGRHGANFYPCQGGGDLEALPGTRNGQTRC